MVSFGGRAAQFDAHAEPYQVCHDVLIGIPGLDVSIGIIGGIVQRLMAGIGMKDSDDLRLGVGAGDIVGDELKVENRGRQIAFERQCANTADRLYVLEFHRNIDVERLSETDISGLLFLKGGRLGDRMKGRQTPS